MKNLFKKLFCLHKWKSYARTTYNWRSTWVYNQNVSETVEILICTKCGKIKQIKY
jgi:Fe2+ or Zn2+ uptake regulation protein